MKTTFLFAILLSTLTGCGICDRMTDRDRDDLPPRPGLFDRDNRSADPRDPSQPPAMHWFGPAKDTPLNPPIPNLPPTREPTAPRAEDPSWRNR